MNRPWAAARLINFTLNICSFQAQLKIRFCCTSIKYRFRENETMMISSAGSRCAESGSCWQKNTDIMGFRRAKKTVHGRQSKNTLAQICSAKVARCHSRHAENRYCKKTSCVLAKIESPITSSPSHIFFYIFGKNFATRTLRSPHNKPFSHYPPLFDPKLALLGRSLHLCAALRNKNQPFWSSVHMILSNPKNSTLF